MNPAMLGMGKRGRDSMIRDIFIAAQRSCRLRRHLDGVSSDTPIRDIVDRCCVWESHSEQGSSSGVGQDQDSLGGSGDSQEHGCLRADSQELMVCPGMDSRVPVPLLEGLRADLPPAGSDIDVIAAYRQDATLTTVREWVQSGAVPVWSDCSGLSPELRCWRLHIGNLSVDTEGRLWRRQAPPSGASQLVVPGRERQDMIRRFHN